MAILGAAIVVGLLWRMPEVAEKDWTEKPAQ
jgi:hypothetical protein